MMCNRPGRAARHSAGGRPPASLRGSSAWSGSRRRGRNRSCRRVRAPAFFQQRRGGAAALGRFAVPARSPGRRSRRDAAATFATARTSVGNKLGAAADCLTRVRGCDFAPKHFCSDRRRPCAMHEPRPSVAEASGIAPVPPKGRFAGFSAFALAWRSRARARCCSAQGSQVVRPGRAGSRPHFVQMPAAFLRRGAGGCARARIASPCRGHGAVFPPRGDGRRGHGSPRCACRCRARTGGGPAGVRSCRISHINRLRCARRCAWRLARGRAHGGPPDRRRPCRPPSIVGAREERTSRRRRQAADRAGPAGRL